MSADLHRLVTPYIVVTVIRPNKSVRDFVENKFVNKRRIQFVNRHRLNTNYIFSVIAGAAKVLVIATGENLSLRPSCRFRQPVLGHTDLGGTQHRHSGALFGRNSVVLQTMFPWY